MSLPIASQGLVLFGFWSSLSRRCGAFVDAAVLLRGADAPATRERKMLLVFAVSDVWVESAKASGGGGTAD